MTEKTRPPTEQQHYLPVAYLKHFAVGEGTPTRTSRIWRFDGKRSIHVPANSQCFERFFYSVNRANEAETIFQGLETAYGVCMAKIKARQQSTARDYIALILVMFDLHIRNKNYENLTDNEELDAYFRRLSWLRGEIAGRHDVVPTDAEVLDALRNYWRVRIIDVAVDHQFITSDNPSMWFTLGKPDKVLDCAILPLSPHFAAVCFDQRQVNITGDQATAKDTVTLNKNQCYRAHNCIFTAQELDEEEKKWVAKALADRPDGRPKSAATKGDVDTLRLGNGLLSFLQVSVVA
jgi:hypothetical protein